MQLNKYIRKNIYRWHRVISLIVAVPLLLWTLSGFLHPVMSMVKPDVKSQAVPPLKLDAAKIKINLSLALRQNGIDSISNFRIVQLDTTCYYQLQQAGKAQLQYISCADGTLLKNGDELYAEQLAQQFLNGTKGNLKDSKEENCHDGAEHAVKQAAVKAVATRTPITEVKLLTRFDEEYKGSQRLLPVYRVAFQRGDDIRLYVETKADRLAYAVDQYRSGYQTFFSAAHTWSFLNGMGKGKDILLGSFAAMSFLTSMFGFYVYGMTAGKRKNKRSFTKSFHRTAGYVFLTTTLLFSFSGAWHAFHKVAEPKQVAAPAYCTQFSADCFKPSFNNVFKSLSPTEIPSNISTVRMYDKNYWQVSYSTSAKESDKKYIDMESWQPVQDGDLKYGCYLACQLSGNKNHCVKKAKQLTSYNHEYSMMNRRLPVVQVSFDDEENYFIETATASLSTVTSASGGAERFSFSNLHMHHYAEMIGAKQTGKVLKNTILITSTLGLLLVALSGIIIYLKRRFL